MELSIASSDVTIRLDDLRVLTELGLLRLPSPDAESRRATSMRNVVAAATTLNQALASHARCMLVNCQGTHGAGDLATETEQLHAALARYAELIQGAVRDREGITGDIRTTSRKGAGSTEARVGASGQRATFRRAVGCEPDRRAGLA